STGAGAQTYGGAVSLNGTGTEVLTGKNVTFDNTVTSVANQGLDVADSGTTVVDGSVNTGTGAQTYSAPVTLPAAGLVTLTGKDVTFDSTVTSTGASLRVADSGTTVLDNNVSTGTGA